MEVIRFDFTELTEVAVVCKKCGAKRTYPLDGERSHIEQYCHCCKEPLKKEDDISLRCLQELAREAGGRDAGYRLEFEVKGRGVVI